MTESPPNADQKARVIVLIYGMLSGNRPFWVFVAVKPTVYKDFLKAQKEGTLDLYAFDGFGEIIVSGEGTTPPEEVTLKVAEVYQTDPRKFFEPTQSEESVAEQVKKIEGE